MFVETPEKGAPIEWSIGSDVYPGWYLESKGPGFDDFGNGLPNGQPDPSIVRILVLRKNSMGEVYPKVQNVRERYVEHRFERIAEDATPLSEHIRNFLVNRQAFLAEQRAKSTIGGLRVAPTATETEAASA